MEKKKISIVRTFSFNLAIAALVLIVVLSIAMSSIGYFYFEKAYTDQYEESAYRTAETAEILLAIPDAEGKYNIDEDGNILLAPDRIDNILAAGETDEYKSIFNSFNFLCEKQNVSIIYVIRVLEGYDNYVIVFDAPNTKTTNYSTKGWEVGTIHPREGDEYKEIYRKLYAKEISEASIKRKGSGSIPDHITSLTAVYDENGDVTALICVQRPMSELSAARRGYMMFVALTTLGMMVVMAVIWYFYAKNQFSNPIDIISQEAFRFATTISPAEQPLSDKISRIHEISLLASSLNRMETETLKNIENLTQITKEKERFGAELNVAKTIQENSLPREFPPFPERNDISIYASMTPAKEVGGDFYDFFFIDDDHLALVIADVSGKGVPAALFMMVTRILINEIAKHVKTASEIIEAVNNRICEHNRADMFVTIWLGILDLKTGEVDAVNAGHDDPAIYKTGGFFGLQQAKHGFIVGGMAGIKFPSYNFKLNPGDKIFLYTDGVPEATRADKAMFKTDGMLASLQNRKTLHPTKIVEGVKADVDRFVGDAPQFDDMTMLCLEYKGHIESKVLTVDATDENLDKVNDFVANTLKEIGCNQKLINQMLLVTEEIYVNIAHYAYKPNVGKAEVKITAYNGVVKLIFTDSGKAYNPLDRKDPDVTLAAEDRKIGGLGIYMTKKLVDGAFYKRKANKNILVLEKEYE